MDPAAAIVTALAAASRILDRSSGLLDKPYRELKLLLAGALAASDSHYSLSVDGPVPTPEAKQLRQRGLSTDRLVLEKTAALAQALLIRDWNSLPPGTIDIENVA